MPKIHKYIFLEIAKGCFLIFFIFLSIAWLLQFTRLISLTSLIQVDIITILYLSIFLIPNLITVIMPFVIMFGLIVTFIKLHKDRELISVYTLGLNINSIIKPLIHFTIFILTILVIFSFYLSPKVYKNYKIKEHEIRNNINFEKIIISNFIEINKNTFLDFKKDDEKFKEVFIKYSDKKDNMIYANEAEILQNKDKFNFNLFNGFKITLVEKNKIEKLEFDYYTLEIKNNSFEEYDNYDNNTFNIFDDYKNKNYVNIFYKITDSFILILIILFFYLNNIKVYRLNINSLLIYVSLSSFILIINQLLKNSEINLYLHIYFIIIVSFLLSIYFFIGKRNVQN